MHMSRIIKSSKEQGGAIGIFDSPIALAKWLIAGPKIARMLETLVDSFNNEVKDKKPSITKILLPLKKCFNKTLNL